jgi:hypothetical protein
MGSLLDPLAVMLSPLLLFTRQHIRINTTQTQTHINTKQNNRIPRTRCLSSIELIEWRYCVVKEFQNNYKIKIDKIDVDVLIFIVIFQFY